MRAAKTCQNSSLGGTLRLSSSPPTACPPPAIRRALTLVELLVVFAIIGLLLALLLPAIQASRSASQRLTCSSNLRQIGLAIANYESAYKMFPPGSSKGKSLFVALLPYVEHADLFERVNYVDSRGADFLSEVYISTYVCPSDSAPRLMPSEPHGLAGTNYAGCSGSWINDSGFRFNGMFATIRRIGPYDSGPITSADVVDGLSRTVAVGEILRADGSGTRLRVAWELPKYYEPGEIEAFAAACRGLPDYPPQQGWKGDQWVRGTPWFRGDFVGTLYNHVLTPNHPSCLNQNNVPSAASTAGSDHPQGVQLLYGDGHVTFTSDKIDVRPWRLLAGRNDKE